MSRFIYHITSSTSWDAAQKSGTYSADSLAGEGFIHCSKADQVLRVANTFFLAQQGLILLEIDLSRLKAQVRWEPGTDKADELFPHIYGPLNLEAVGQVFNLKAGMDGTFSLPVELIK